MDINMDHYTRGYETGQCKYTEKSIESGENTENGPRNIELWDAYNEDGPADGGNPHPELSPQEAAL